MSFPKCLSEKKNGEFQPKEDQSRLYSCKTAVVENVQWDDGF